MMSKALVVLAYLCTVAFGTSSTKTVPALLWSSEPFFRADRSVSSELFDMESVARALRGVHSAGTLDGFLNAERSEPTVRVALVLDDVSTAEFFELANSGSLDGIREAQSQAESSLILPYVRASHDFVRGGKFEGHHEFVTVDQLDAALDVEEGQSAFVAVRVNVADVTSTVDRVSESLAKSDRSYLVGLVAQINAESNEELLTTFDPAEPAALSPRANSHRFAYLHSGERVLLPNKWHKYNARQKLVFAAENGIEWTPGQGSVKNYCGFKQCGVLPNGGYNFLEPNVATTRFPGVVYMVLIFSGFLIFFVVLLAVCLCRMQTPDRFEETKKKL